MQSDGTLLITGGAGFIGTWLTRALSEKGIRPVIVDNLLPQVHGESPKFSSELTGLADCIQLDVSQPETWVEIGSRYPNVAQIVHLAALTGTGQSMFDIGNYDRVNTGGCAVLAEAVLLKSGGGFQSTRQVVVSSSRAVYGEGAYHCNICNVNEYPNLRTEKDLTAARWNPVCPKCGTALETIPTPEDAPHRPASFYGLTKSVQESYLQMLLRSASVELTTLRFQNVYGPGQSLRNPYTGVIGVFYSRMLQNLPIDIFEDGDVTRDFVYVTDIVDSILRSLEFGKPGVFNVGSGKYTRLMYLAELLRGLLNSSSDISVNGHFRVGDIRHNAADIRAIQSDLGFIPRVSLEEGIKNYVQWAASEEPLTEAETGKALLDFRHRRQ